MMTDSAAVSSKTKEREREEKTWRPRAASAAAVGRAPEREDSAAKAAAAKKPTMVVALKPTLLAPACPQQSCSLRLPERLEGRVEDAPPALRG